MLRCISVNLFEQDKGSTGSLKTVTQPNKELLLKKLLVTYDDVMWTEMHVARSLIINVAGIFDHEILSHICECIECIDWANKSSWGFSRWLIMGRPHNWHDPRSLVLKIWDIRFIGIITPINHWEFQIDSTSNSWDAGRMFWNMSSLVLSWWPDFEWPWAEIFYKVCGKNGGKGVPKAAVSALLPKNLGVFTVHFPVQWGAG